MAIKIKVIDEEAEKNAAETRKPPVETKTAAKKAKPTAKKAAVKKTGPKKAEPKSDQSKTLIKDEIEKNLKQAENIIEEKKKAEAPKPVEPVLAKKAEEAETDPVKKLIKREREAAMEKETGQKEPVEKLVEPSSAKEKKSLRLYRRIAYFFVLLVLILLASLSYFTFKKVKIVLVPNQERKSSNLIFDIHDNASEPLNSTSIAGLVRNMEVSAGEEYEASGTEVIGKETIGEVVIYNNYTQNQPLVATTRLLTPDSKLFRIAETVNVPAGSSVKAEIYADQPGPDMVVGPTKFTIPGLWAGLQDKIFAESTADTVYRQKVKKFVQESDFDEAKKDLRQKLLNIAKQEISQNYSDYSEAIYKIDENSIVTDFDASTGETTDDFSAAMEASVVVVAFNKEQSAELSREKFVDSLSNNMEIIDFNKESIIYTLNNYDAEAGNATINATFEGKVSLKEGSEIFKKEQIVGLKKEQLEVFLDNLEGISGYEVQFMPSFLPSFMKTVPKLVDKIEIEVRK